MDSRLRLVRALLWIILAAAVLTAPVFLFAESFDREHVVRVALSNGLAALLCAGPLAWSRRGHAEAIGRVLVFGLLALVASLAWTNGEDVHVNVVNFVLVAVLASVLTERRILLGVACVSAAAMCAIAWKQAVPPAGEELFEARLESIAQFLPTYAVIVLVLALRERREREVAGRTPSDDAVPVRAASA
ncbi:MAG: hypothetical protein L6Q99_13935 [Planctomycetes bacterium]|nr:hypothetical protein [Planctomycetota bacterium]